MPTQGTIEAFTGKSWSSWIERLGFYFVANSINNVEKKRALLLTLCGPETYDIVRALVAPRTPATVSFEELVSILGAHFDPQALELYSRVKFQRRDQLADESINEYVEALKQLAVDCNFSLPTTSTTAVATTSSQHPPAALTYAAEATTGTPATPRQDTRLALDIMLRDRFVCGIRDELLQQRLFAEQDLTFSAASDIAVRAESASKQQKEIKSKVEPQVNKTEKKNKDSSTQQGRRCYRCTGQHDPQECRFKNTDCRYCNKRGHIEKACIAKKKQQGSKTRKKANHMMAASEETSGAATSPGCSFYELNKLATTADVPKFQVTLRIYLFIYLLTIPSGP
ncbi:uncharacterized protein ISCGN_018236 [Ixodes scapularis]